MTTGRGRGLALLALLALVWGLFWPIMKITLVEMPIFTFRAGGTLLALAAMVAIARARGQSLYVPPGQRWPLVVAGLLNVGGWLYFSALAVSLMPAGRAALIAYTMPVWAFLLAMPLLGERATPGRLAGLVLGMAGIAVLAGDDLMRLGEFPLGALAMLAGAISFGCGASYQKSISWTVAPFAMIAWQFLVGAVPMIIGAVPELSQLKPYSWPTWGGFLYSSLVGQVIGLAIWFRVLAALPIRTASLSILAVPLVGVLSSALMLGEPLGVTELVAGALIAGAIVTVLPRGSEQPQRPL